MIYLDNAATTRVYDCAIAAAEKAMRDDFFNPNTTYAAGVRSNTELENCRRQIASAVGAASGELIFTSCATEANNWVLTNGRKNRKGNVVISAGEHASVYETAMQLKNRGTDVRIVPLTPFGMIDENAFINAVDADTALISVIHVSNETGAVNPVKRLASMARQKSPHALFHSDGVQGLLKTQERISDLGVDFYSASAHKIGGPKGIGLLYIRNGLNIAPLLYGGGQERGLRSGTQNTPYIAAFAAAAETFKSAADRNRISAIRNELSDIFTEHGFKIIGSGNNSGYILCVCIPGVKAEILQNAVSDRGLIIGKGSACSGAKRGNRVLAAMGLDDKSIECCIRISLFADTSRDDAVSAANMIIEEASKIRSGNVG